MSFSVKKRPLSPIELEYAAMKKQSAADRSKSKPSNFLKRSQLSDSEYDVTLASTNADAENQPRKRPSQPVTLDEKQALITRFALLA